MPSEDTRLAVLEFKMDNAEKILERYREHFRDLLTFKSKWEGGLSTVLWIMGFVGFANLVAVGLLAYKIAK